MGKVQEEGVVVGINAGTAVVQINKASACAHCKAGCMERGGFMVTEAENSVGAKVGDAVHLEFDSKTAFNALLIVFGLPLLALLLGVILTAVVTGGIGYEDHRQLLSIIVGFAMFFLAFIPIRAYDKRIGRSGVCNFAIVEVLGKADSSAVPD